jgi:hypothetical protein
VKNWPFLIFSRTTFNQSEKFLRYYPQFSEWYKYVFSKFNGLCEKVDEIIKPIRQVENQAEFAKLVPKVPWANLVFVLKRNPQFATCAEYLCDTKWIDDSRGTRSLELALFNK